MEKTQRHAKMGSLRTTFVLLVGWLVCLANSITFEQKLANVYDVAPKVRITGQEFSGVDADTLKLTFVPKLKLDKDYTMAVQSDTVIVLSLKPGRRWAKFKEGDTPKALYLASAKVGDTTVLEDSVQIATIVPAPTVETSSHEIYMKTTPKLVVNGTNFNVKNTELYFDPPLEEGVQIQKQVLSGNQISIVKIYNYDNPITWTDEPGPLRIKAINTGAGRLTVGAEDGGVVIAEVQADDEAHGITVEDHESIDIYQSTKELKISGQGFLTDTKVRFANALRGGGTNFTITDTQPTQLTLKLQEGSTWRKNPEHLPNPLVLLAANAGAGWVPLGPTTAKAGRKVATVFEDPSVVSSKTEIFRTHTHELAISGTGFNRMFKPEIEFDPPIDLSQMFMEVVNRTSVKLTLSSVASQWAAEDKLGPLSITGMNTGAGMVKFDSPVQVATVVADTEVHESGVHVQPYYGQPKYQSSSDKPLTIFGAGFKGEPVLNFDPPIWSPANYTLEVASDTELKLSLVKGSMWNKFPGALLLKGINVGDGDVQLAAGKGVKVATILEDPVVNDAEMLIYASHTKSFPVRGSGFVSVEDPGQAPSILLDGIPSSTYKIQDNWHNGVFSLQLTGDQWADVSEGQEKVIKLMSIDTGAGVIAFPGGVKIAEVRPDSLTAMCEDSCSFAQDGQCDEPGALKGSSSWGDYNGFDQDMMSYQPYGWGYDDDANSLLSTSEYSGGYRYAGYEMTYHAYGEGMTDDGFYNALAPCELGTDCSDCGVKFIPDGTCENTCQHARDGACDDPRMGGTCPAGSDCQDCGEWGDAGSNYTDTSFYVSRQWFDDDDWELLANDDAVLLGQENNAQPQYKRWNDHHVKHPEPPGAGTIFVDVLWAMVVLVGCSVSIGGAMVAYRHFKAGGGGAAMYLPVQAADEVELSRRGNSAGAETTPDVVRIG